VFETMLVLSGVPVEIDRHLARLERSVRDLYREHLPAASGAMITAAAREYSVGRVRLTLVPDVDGLVADVTSAAVAPELVFPGWELGSRLTPFVASPIGAHKWADRDQLERFEKAAHPAVPLLVTDGGTVLEASRGNVFAVIGGVLVTPPADGRILPGISRDQVLELARAEGIDASERSIDLEELQAADEVFLTGAVRGVEPVVECGDRTSFPGDVTPRLAMKLRERWRAYT